MSHSFDLTAIPVPRDEHLWVDRRGRGWIFALIEVVFPDFPRMNLRTAVLIREDDYEGDNPDMEPAPTLKGAST